MICALLSFYDEKPDWLADLVESLPKAGVQHLVVVDGAYGSFPGARPRSHDHQHRALIRAARRARIALSLHIPDRVWASEVEKRTAMFRYGEAHTTERDFYLVVDGDERITDCPPDLGFELANQDLDVAEVTLTEPHPQAKTQNVPLRMIFRAIRGLEVKVNHYTYVCPDGRKLWARGREEPAFDLTDQVTVEHRTHFRPKPRKEAAYAYYRHRDSLGLEVGECERCGSPGVKELPCDWEEVAPDPVTGLSRLSADWVTVCDSCARTVSEENRVAVARFGLDYSTIQVTMERAKPKVAA